MSCLELPEIEAAFGRSNLSPNSWPANAKLLDDMCEEQGIRAADLGTFTEFSLAEGFRSPNGIPAVSDKYLLVVIDVGLAMLCEKGAFRKQTDCQYLMFSEIKGGSFLAEESMGGRGWGYMAVQAARGSVPVFRLGWYFDERSSVPLHSVNAAANERDRILQAIHRWI